MENYNFKEFSDYIMLHIADVLGEEEKCRIYLKKVSKNNGVVLTALQILPEGSNCTPSLYLEPYYQKYCEGIDIFTIMEEMVKFYHSHQNEFEVDVEEFDSFCCMRSKIIMRLVNYEKNEQVLKDCPYIKWHDLAVTFRWLAHSDDIGIATALITNQEMEKWQVSIEELYTAALENTPVQFPLCCENMEKVLVDFATDSEELAMLQQEIKQHKQEKNTVEMYIFSNEQRINGATSILYPEALRRFAKEKNADFYMLPSSVHEMIFIPDNVALRISDLKQMVLDANLNVVSDSELLSNHIYYYNREKNAVKML